MKIDVKKVAKLANLPLTPEEEKKFEAQLNETLNYVNKLEEIDTTNIEPTSQVTGLENVTREDLVTASLSQEEALKNAHSTSSGQAKSTYKGFIKVKAILDQEANEY